jgi:hypothetical protein
MERIMPFTNSKVTNQLLKQLESVRQQLTRPHIRHIRCTCLTTHLWCLAQDPALGIRRSGLACQQQQVSLATLLEAIVRFCYQPTLLRLYCV